MAAVLLTSAISALAQLDPHGPWYPFPNGGAPVASGQSLIAQGGEVTVTFLGPTSAGYSEDLFVASPANGFGHFFNNHSTPNGTVLSLGVWPAGTELIFGLDVHDTGDQWFTGPATRNSDGFVHAYMVDNYQGLPNTTYVGFEDLNGTTGADWNYVDEVFAFTGVQSSVPEPTTLLPLLGASALGVWWHRRQRRQK